MRTTRSIRPMCWCWHKDAIHVYSMDNSWMQMHWSEHHWYSAFGLHRSSTGVTHVLEVAEALVGRRLLQFDRRKMRPTGMGLPRLPTEIPKECLIGSLLWCGCRCRSSYYNNSRGGWSMVGPQPWNFSRGVTCMRAYRDFRGFDFPTPTVCHCAKNPPQPPTTTFHAPDDHQDGMKPPCPPQHIFSIYFQWPVSRHSEPLTPETDENRLSAHVTDRPRPPRRLQL